MNFSAEHRNWLVVGEMFPLIQKPVSSYVDEIVRKFHENLCQDFDNNASCTKPDCKKTTSSCGLCSSCQKWWLTKLEMVHKKEKNSSRSKNCDGEKWYDRHWEVAKFFMPALGNNRLTVINANSTELSSLLNVLEWMKDKAFLGKMRVNLDSLRKLRSEVRNTWAHAPNHELSDQQKEDYFKIAANFLKDLKKVFTSEISEIERTEGSLEDLKTNGISNLVKSDIENLFLKFDLLNQIKEELVKTRQDRLSSGKAIEDLTDELQKVKNSLDDCQRRTAELVKPENDINDQFESLAQQLTSFGCKISEDISDINSIVQFLHDSKENGREFSSCLPEKLLNFTARDKEIKDVIKFLQEEDMGVVALYGGPGFGKSALAVEVSHRLFDHNMVVIFSDLSTASTINEVILRLCLDVGINPEEYPKSSLILWLKNLNKEVIFVLDDVDNLLQTRSQTRSEFDEFIRLLRKNSNQKLKIITTSRTSFTIRDISKFQKIKIEEMNELSSMALLKSLCPDQNDELLKSLAQRCGYVPLAMCIAASLVKDFDNSKEILKHLEDQPMRALNNSESNQFVYGAFNTSFKYLSREQKDTLLRLTIFEGDFSENAAKAVLNGDDIQQRTLLTELVNRSLLKKSGNHRYSIHLLIRSFLVEQSESEKKRAEAEKLMVAYFLDLCAKSTIQSYSHDKFLENRDILKRETHNIENALTICGKLPDNPEIANVLADSEIYQSSCRFFYNIVKTIISATVLGTFLQACADLAQARKEWTNKINFDCMLIDQEGRKSFWNSDAYFQKMMATEIEFQKYKEHLTKDVALQGYFFYQLGRCFLNQYKDYKNNGDSESAKYQEVLRFRANEHLCKSWELRKGLPQSPLAKADPILSLIQLGNLWKKTSSKQYGQNAKEDSEKSIQQAVNYYKDAIEQAENNLGKHELTSACYKFLGDLFLQSRQNQMAMEYYNFASDMREELNLNSSEEYVLLLNNIGRCFMFLGRYDDAIEKLEKAGDIAEKLVEDDQPAVGKGKVYTSLAMTYNKSKTNSEKAKEFAQKALKINTEMNNTIIKEKEVKILQNIRKCQLEPRCTRL